MELRERKLVNPTNRDLEVKIPEMTISFAESVMGDSQQRKVMTTCATNYSQRRSIAERLPHSKMKYLIAQLELRKDFIQMHGITVI